MVLMSSLNQHQQRSSLVEIVVVVVLVTGTRFSSLGCLTLHLTLRVCERKQPYVVVVVVAMVVMTVVMVVLVEEVVEQRV